VAAMANYLADCVVQKKCVLIISDCDCDCDCATACAVLAMAFGASGMNFDYLVLDRAIHGYGLTPAIVEEAAALEIKPDVIITLALLPLARLIGNPNQEGCGYRSKDIAGCGVATSPMERWLTVQQGTLGMLR
jgi:single-stranded-DNA-specific exonuclease